MSPGPTVSTRPIVGWMPAAGRAARLGGLPCSKEIFPVGFEPGPDGEPRPRPVCHGLLRGWAGAGIERALVILRHGKWDVPTRLGSGAELGLDLAYLLVEETGSVPETLARAAGWTEALGTGAGTGTGTAGAGGWDVALGFPDILLGPPDAWARLVDFHRAGDWPISLGLFPTDQAWKADMVSFDDQGRIEEIVIKDPACAFRWTWSIALWRPDFTRFLRRTVAAEGRREGGDEGGAELYVGDVIRKALAAGYEVRGLPFADGRFIDVGTPDDLRRAVHRFAASPVDVDQESP